MVLGGATGRRPHSLRSRCIFDGYAFSYSWCIHSAFLHVPYIRKPVFKRIRLPDRTAMTQVRALTGIFWGTGAEFAHTCWNAG
jgi:hypothetical protein